jgi:hypothetical protein
MIFPQPAQYQRPGIALRALRPSFPTIVRFAAAIFVFLVCEIVGSSAARLSFLLGRVHGSDHRVRRRNSRSQMCRQMAPGRKPAASYSVTDFGLRARRDRLTAENCETPPAGRCEDSIGSRKAQAFIVFDRSRGLSAWGIPPRTRDRNRVCESESDPCAWSRHGVDQALRPQTSLRHVEM